MSNAKNISTLGALAAHLTNLIGLSNSKSAIDAKVAQSAVTSFNGSTGAVTFSAPVTSVNGSTGAVTVPSGFTTLVVLTAASGTWTPPAGVTRIKATAVGGGGGGAGTTSGGNGGISALSGIVAATGGVGGTLASTPGVGGIGSTGTLLVRGGSGNYQSQQSPGGLSTMGASYGAGGASASNQPSGGAGGTAVAYATVTPGTGIAYQTGTAGTAGSGASAGQPGVILIEY